MNKEKAAFWCHLTVSAFGVAAVAYIFFKTLFMPVLPFFIAFLAAYILDKPSAYISQKLHIPRKLVGVILTILCVVVGLGIIVSLTVWGLNAAWHFLSGLKDNKSFFEILAKLTDPFGGLLGDSGEALDQHVGAAVSEALSAIVSKLFSILSGFAAAIPGVLLFILVTAISSIYFSLDLVTVKSFLLRIIPPAITRWLHKISRGCRWVCAKYLRSYLLIMLITFVIMLIGFLLLGIRLALPLSILVAILDLLPLIGVGTVLVPWSVYQLIGGNSFVGIGLIALLVINEVVRQFVEPKIIGKNLGVHPIISLMLIYVGYSVFGFAGLILTPVVGVVLNIFLNKNDPSHIG